MRSRRVGGVAMDETVFYDPVGHWLTLHKGCVSDQYSHGYLKNVKVGTAIPDVVGVKYEVIEEESQAVIHFHAHVVEVKADETGLNDLLGKIVRTKESAQIQTDDWRSGLNTVRFYIAYPFDKTPQDVYSFCKKNGIGMLRLERPDDDHINIYELPKTRPEEVKLQGISHRCQQNPGCFVEAIQNDPCLRKMFPAPSDLYYDFIKPKREEYRENLKIRAELDKVKSKPAREALNLLIEKIRQSYPEVMLKATGGLHFEVKTCDRKETLLSIRTTSDYFYISLDGHRYRIYSKDKIHDFDGDFQEKLETLIRTLVMPQIQSKLG